MSNPALPSSARVVVIGGGIIGCSVAYHLAHLGCEVLLLERDRLTSGTTWHAAGLIVTFGSTSETSTELRRYSRDLYSRLPAETGQETGFRPCGFIEVAAVGVPGGSVTAALGILESTLGLDQSGLGLMVALFMIQDSFGTAANVTGDGALTMIVDKAMHGDDVKSA